MSVLSSVTPMVFHCFMRNSKEMTHLVVSTMQFADITLYSNFPPCFETAIKSPWELVRTVRAMITAVFLVNSCATSPIVLSPMGLSWDSTSFIADTELVETDCSSISSVPLSFEYFPVWLTIFEIYRRSRRRASSAERDSVRSPSQRSRLLSPFSLASSHARSAPPLLFSFRATTPKREAKAEILVRPRRSIALNRDL